MISLSVLLVAALCLDASMVEKILYLHPERKSWSEARLHCQRHHSDLLTKNADFDKVQLDDLLKDTEVHQVWIGLFRDPKNDSVWKWIDLKSEDGISGEIRNWADGEPSSHCAVLLIDSTWASVRCSNLEYFHCSSAERKKTKHHTDLLSWHNASQFCRDAGGDLATITNTTNTGRVADFGWIGLYQEAGDTWKWIGDGPSDYRNWAPEQPLTADCGSFNRQTQKFYSNNCSEEMNFVCYGDNLVVVKENKTWEDARRHCETMETPCEDGRSCKYHHQLLSLNRLSDYDYVRDRINGATTDEVWTSLRFLGGEWWWMDGRRPEDQGRLRVCPSGWKHCGTLSKHNHNKWITRDCSENRNFICSRHEVRILHKRNSDDE